MFRKMYLLLLFLTLPLLAENWPGWRGPAGNGISQSNVLPESWSEESNIDWRLTLAGPAASTPILWNDKLFLTSTKGNDFLVMAVSTEGKVLWEDVVGTGNKSFRQGESNYAAPSPSTDGEKVYAFFGNGDLVGYTVNGKQVWKRNLADEFGAFNMYFGMASSPLLHKGNLYVLLMHSDAQLVLSIDKSTGETVWKHNRKTNARRDNLHYYDSPMIYENENVTQLIIHGSDV
ncbi:MAG: PQQ-binding-like beta-propeller repeat protein, partial [Calditrichota bacterium]